MKHLVKVQFITDVYEALAEMFVKLDLDPLSLGPKRLNRKIGKVSNYRTECSRVQCVIQEHLQRFKRKLRVIKFEFSEKERKLLIEDPEVNAKSSFKERLAVAHQKLSDELEILEIVSAGIEELEMVLVAIKVKRVDLKDTENRLKDQMNMSREERKLGNVWGSDKGMSKSEHAEAVEDISNFDRIFQEVEEISKAAEEAAVEDPFEKDEVDSFLGDSDGELLNLEDLF